jgi:hypothetical protein
MKTSMTIEQVLNLALRTAKQQAPPPPAAAWFRAQLEKALPPEAVEAPAAPEWLVFARQAWAVMFQMVSQPLKSEPVKTPVHADSEAFAFVDSKPEVPIFKRHIPSLGFIPALALHGSELVPLKLEVTHAPQISEDGFLGLRVRVVKAKDIFKLEQSLEIALLVGPEEVIASPQVLIIGNDQQLIFNLPRQLQEDWRKVEKWTDLPLRFLLRPSCNQTTLTEVEAASAKPNWSESQQQRLPHDFRLIGKATALVYSILGVERTANRRRPVS